MSILGRISLRSLALAIAVVTGACRSGSADGPTDPSKQQKELKIVTGRGVIAQPAGSGRHPSGERVSYSFALEPGFTNLIVRLDGVEAAPAGSVTMDTDRVLAATADSASALGSVDSIAISAARTILTADDPRRVLASLYQNAWNDERIRGTGAAAQTVSNVAAHSFVSADFSALGVVHERLRGQVFDIDLPEAPSLSAAASVSDPAALPFTLIYINGMLTSPSEAVENVFMVRNVVTTANLPDFSRPAYRVKHLYNATWSERRAEATFCRAATLVIAIKARVSPFGVVRNVASVCGFFADLTRAALDIAELIGWVPGSSPEASALTEMLFEERRQGRGVILIGHSQGTLIAQNAMRATLESVQNLESSSQRCAGFVSLGSPLPNGFLFRHQRTLFVAGNLTKDIILQLPTTSGSTGIPNSLAVDSDAATAFWNELNLGGWAQVYFGLRLHAFESYLQSPPLRETIQAELRNQVARIRQNCVQQPTGLSIVTGPTATAVNAVLIPAPTAQLQDSEGNRVGTSTASVNVSLSASTGVLSGTRTVQAVNGIVSFTDLRVTVPGTYRLVFSSGGLSTATSAPFVVSSLPCASTAVSVPFGLNGDMRSAQCQFFGAPATAYDFSSGVQRAFRFGVSQNGFIPRIGVRTRDGVDGAYVTFANAGAASSIFLLSAGEYTTVLGAPSGALSSFSFSGVTTSESAGGCEQVVLLRSPVLTSAQSLSGSDCAAGSRRYDMFMIGNGRTCTIDMKSAAFDTYLEVYDRNGSMIASDDDGGEGTDSRVTLSNCYSGSDSNFIFMLRVRATSYAETVTGSYTIEFRFEQPSALSEMRSPAFVTTGGTIEAFHRSDTIPDRPPKAKRD